MHALRAAIIIAPMYFLANCLYNYSLYMTSVSSSTIISNLAASFTLFFSWWAGLEDITWSKVAGLLLCFFGAIAVGLNDAGDQVPSESQVTNGSVGGDLVALLSAMGYGAYTTLIRLQLPDEESVSMQLVLGYIGTVIFSVLLPFVLILVFASSDDGEFAGAKHMSFAAFGFIILGGLCDNVFSDYLWARAVVLTSPTVATVGMSITIPFAMLSDYLLGRQSAAPIMSYVGAALVILGFVLVNFEPETLELLWRRYCGGSGSRGGGWRGGTGTGTGAGAGGNYSLFSGNSSHHSHQNGHYRDKDGLSAHHSASRDDYVRQVSDRYFSSSLAAGAGAGAGKVQGWDGGREGVVGKMTGSSVQRSASDDGDTDSETGLVSDRTDRGSPPSI
jgi:drug/metabolite transporter (DMT)-like permease